MLRPTPRRWIPRLFLSAIFLLIPAWSHATSFTFTQMFGTGETVTGAFTLASPAPTPFSGDFTLDGAMPTLTALTLTTSGFPMGFNISIVDSTTGFSGISIKDGTVEFAIATDVTPTGTLRVITFNFGTPSFLSLGVDLEPQGGVPIEANAIGTGGPPTVSPAAVPEPSTYLLFGSGLLGLAGYRWHQRRREETQLR